MNLIEKKQSNDIQIAIAIYCIVILLLLIATLPIQEYLYYQILRWVVCLFSVFMAVIASSVKKKGPMWTMGIIAIIFNPIIPIRLDKETWVIVDFASAVIYLINIFIFSFKKWWMIVIFSILGIPIIFGILLLIHYYFG